MRTLAGSGGVLVEKIGWENSMFFGGDSPHLVPSRQFPPNIALWKKCRGLVEPTWVSSSNHRDQLEERGQQGEDEKRYATYTSA